MALSNRSLGIALAVGMLVLIVVAMLYRKYGGHEPITAPVPSPPTPVEPTR